VFSHLLAISEVSSWEQVFFRLTISLLVLLVLLRGKLRLLRRDLGHFVSTGFVFSIFLLSGLSSVAFGCPIGVVSALFETQPFFTAVISHFTRREKLTLTKLFLVVVGMTGAFLTSGATLDEFIKLEMNPGVILSLSGGFLYAMYLFLKRKKTEEYAPLQALFNVILFSVPCTVIVGLALRAFVKNPHITGFAPLTPEQIFLLATLAVCCTVIPYGFLNKVNPKEVSPTAEGIILLLEPVLTNVWGLVFFRQFVKLSQYFGIFLILSSTVATLNVKSK